MRTKGLNKIARRVNEPHPRKQIPDLIKTYIGIDNGVSGSIGIITPTGWSFFHIPTFVSLNYAEKMKNVTRIHTEALSSLLHITNPHNALLLIEKPMVNPGRFIATLSAIRALEATLITVERLGIKYQYVDSRTWQKDMLPNVKGSDDLKKASLGVGSVLFPQLKHLFKTDADGLLIAEWAKRKRL